MTPILELVDASKSFGGVKVIDQLSVSLEKGQALGVVGPNGAGKTTMLNLITGVVRLDSGRVLVEGQDITNSERHARVQHGVARTFQIPRPFEKMTVFENALVAGAHGRGTTEGASYQCAVDALERVGLLHRANIPAGSLTLLERKRLELARALATEPRILLLDEIAGGLTEAEVRSLIETIRDLWSQGISIVWIEHIVHALLAVVDRIVCIHFGRKLLEGDPENVMCSPEVQDVYLGSEPVCQS
jgi:branched-chain amino acid transport system ATP-binding protein